MSRFSSDYRIATLGLKRCSGFFEPPCQMVGFGCRRFLWRCLECSHFAVGCFVSRFVGPAAYRLETVMRLAWRSTVPSYCAESCLSSPMGCLNAACWRQLGCHSPMDVRRDLSFGLGIGLYQMTVVCCRRNLNPKTSKIRRRIFRCRVVVPFVQS